MALSKISSFREYAISRRGTDLLKKVLFVQLSVF